MHEHDESSSTDVVHTPGEADEEDGRYVVDDLLLEVLDNRTWWRQTWLLVRAPSVTLLTCQGIFLGKIMALAPPVALIKMSLKVTTSPPPADSTPVSVFNFFFELWHIFYL